MCSGRQVCANLATPLTNNKWPLGVDPGGRHFVVLNVSINKKPISVLYVVVYGTKEKTPGPILRGRDRRSTYKQVILTSNIDLIVR